MLDGMFFLMSVLNASLGRVKTLHPSIHGGILAKRSNPTHLETLQSQSIPLIDIVSGLETLKLLTLDLGGCQFISISRNCFVRSESWF